MKSQKVRITIILLVFSLVLILGGVLKLAEII